MIPGRCRALLPWLAGILHNVGDLVHVASGYGLLRYGNPDPMLHELSRYVCTCHLPCFRWLSCHRAIPNACHVDCKAAFPKFERRFPFSFSRNERSLFVVVGRAILWMPVHLPLLNIGKDAYHL